MYLLVAVRNEKKNEENGFQRFLVCKVKKKMKKINFHKFILGVLEKKKDEYKIFWTFSNS